MTASLFEPNTDQHKLYAAWEDFDPKIAKAQNEMRKLIRKELCSFRRGSVMRTWNSQYANPKHTPTSHHPIQP